MSVNKINEYYPGYIDDKKALIAAIKDDKKKIDEFYQVSVYAKETLIEALEDDMISINTYIYLYNNMICHECYILNEVNKLKEI